VGGVVTIVLTPTTVLQIEMLVRRFVKLPVWVLLVTRGLVMDLVQVVLVLMGLDLLMEVGVGMTSHRIVHKLN